MKINIETSDKLVITLVVIAVLVWAACKGWISWELVSSDLLRFLSSGTK